MATSHPTHPHNPTHPCAAVALWLQALSLGVPTAAMLLVQARAYSAYRARCAQHWLHALRHGGRHRHIYAAPGPLPPPHADEWQYAAALRGLRGMQEHALVIAACAVAAVLWLFTG